MRRLYLLPVYLCLLPLILLSLALYLVIRLNSLSPNKSAHLTQAVQFQSIPDDIQATSYTLSPHEARVEVLAEFFKRYDSPLFSFAKRIVESADKYGIDWRLIPSIAMTESTLCKNTPKNSFNCWGFGIYGGKVTRFEGYADAIDTVTKTLAQEYKEKRGLEQPNEIVTRYTPGSTTWADKVTFVMDKIQSNL